MLTPLRVPGEYMIVAFIYDLQPRLVILFCKELQNTRTNLLLQPSLSAVWSAFPDLWILGNIPANKCLCEIQERMWRSDWCDSEYVLNALIAKLQFGVAPPCHGEVKYLHSQLLNSSANVLTALKWLLVFHFTNPRKTFLFLEDCIGK